MEISALLMVLWLMASHWVADFVFQTEHMALNKSTSNVALGKHVGAYTAVLGVLTVVPFFSMLGATSATENAASVMDTFAAFLLLNAALHFATDFVTSRAVKLEFANENKHNGFVIIGIDQLIHHTCILLTFFWFTNQIY